MDILHVIQRVTDTSSPPPDSRYLQSLKMPALLDLGRPMRIAKEAGVEAKPRLEFGVPDACLREAVEKTQPRVLVKEEPPPHEQN